MTLKIGDIIFIILISIVAGGGTAMLANRYMAPPPPAEQAKILVFNSGQFVMDELARMAVAPTQPEDPSAVAILRSNAFAGELAAQGFIVLDADSVVAAPMNSYVDPTKRYAKGDAAPSAPAQ